MSSLVVVDLESRGRVRGVLGQRARRLAARPRTHVLLHLPEGAGPPATWPGGGRVSRTIDYVSCGRLREIHERAFARSFEIARGAIGAVFPEVCAVGLGELNLMTIQRHLASYSIVALAVGDLVDSGSVTACHILSADVGFAAALEDQIAGRVAAVSKWPPRWLLDGERWARAAWSAPTSVRLREAEAAARDAMRARLHAHRLDRRHPRVLVVSESAPIAQMFGVVEAALARAWMGPVVRLDFSGAATPAHRTSAALCDCGPHGTLGLRTGPFAARWRDAERTLRRKQASTGANAHDAVSLDGLVGYLYASKLDAQARHVWAADTALDILQPELILVGNDRWWGGQAFVQLARRRGIPSVCVQDGVAGEHPSWWWLAADRMAATSEPLVQMLVRHGVQRERCCVTGQPRFDALARFSPDDQRAARAALGLDPSRFSVLFAAQSMHGPDYVRGVVAALRAVPGIHIMLRPHPSDSRGLWERLLREYRSGLVSLHRTADSITLARACDALVTQHSTVALEAALLGKPVVTTDFGGLHGPTPVIDGAIATQVCGVEELTSEVHRLATATPKQSPSRRAALEALVGPVDGYAGERVAELVAEMLAGAPCTSPAARGAVA